MKQSARLTRVARARTQISTSVMHEQHAKLIKVKPV